MTSSVAVDVDALEIEGADAVEEPLALPEHHRRDVQPQLVDRACGEVLVDRRGAARDRHVAVAGGLARLRQRRLDAVGDEVEGRAALHRHGLTGDGG